VKRLLSILLMNAWGGLRNAVNLPTAAMVLCSALTLVVASNMPASASPDAPVSVAQTTGHVFRQVTHSRTLALLGSKSSRASKRSHNFRHDGQRQIASDQSANNTTSSGEISGSTTGNATQTVSAVLNMAAVQQACEQGQMADSVQSAELDFQTPTTTSETVTWYWETRVDSGPDASGTPETVGSQSSQTVTAGTSKVTLTANDPSQPLFSTTENPDYTYSFRLHVVVGSSDITSAWTSVPQATGACTQD
jgi:hypothetical protein